MSLPVPARLLKSTLLKSTLSFVGAPAPATGRWR